MIIYYIKEILLRKSSMCRKNYVSVPKNVSSEEEGDQLKILNITDVSSILYEKIKCDHFSVKFSPRGEKSEGWYLREPAASIFQQPLKT